MWPPNYIQWPYSMPLEEMSGLGTEEACHRYSHPVAQGWKLCASGGGHVETSGWMLEARTSEVEPQEAQKRAGGARSKLRGVKLAEAHPAAQICATQWLQSS